MYALPHQTALMALSLLDSDESKSAQTFLSSIHCIKGKLTALVGDVWRLQYHTPALGWDYPIADTNKLRFRSLVVLVSFSYYSLIVLV